MRHPSKVVLHVINPFINIQKGGDIQAPKQSACQVAHCAYHSGSRMIKCINIRELPFYKILLSCHKDFILNDNYY